MSIICFLFSYEHMNNPIDGKNNTLYNKNQKGWLSCLGILEKIEKAWTR